MTEKIVCGFCGDPVPLTKSGKLRMHRVGPDEAECLGSRLPVANPDRLKGDKRD